VLNRLAILDNLILGSSRTPLFAPVILGFGIIFGVFYPIGRLPTLLVFIAFALLAFVLLHEVSRVAAFLVLIFSVGFYVVQTGGLLETTLLAKKQFVMEDVDAAEFTATVKFIDETHPTMKNMQRITLDDIKFPSAPELKFIKTAKMTCSVRSLQSIEPNDIVKVKGKINPYKLAAIPSSFDQRQYNSLVKLDATGIVYYVIKKPDSPGKTDVFSYLRRAITKRIIEKMGPMAGGIASALFTGDKSSVAPDIRDKYINSGTAHILAISGLHMSIVASIVFLTLYKIVQYTCMSFPAVDPRRISAILTVLITFFYLKISGASPSAIRAFIMTTVFLISTFFGRKAISLRSVAFAAFAILLFDPGSLFLVSFQLSFSAVVAIIASYEVLREKIHEFMIGCKTAVEKIIFYVASSALTTTIASVATFPISVATFNRFSLVSLLGNIIAIPAISFIVMPLAMISFIACLCTDFFIIILKMVLTWLTDVLGYISSLPGSVITICSPSLVSIYTIMTGGIILSLLHIRHKYIGASICMLGTLMWIFEGRPDVVIPPNSGVVCFVKGGKFFATSLQKSRLQVLSVQNNLGLSGKPTKVNYDELPDATYERGLYIWTRSGKVMQLAVQKHPYCPAHFTKVDNHVSQEAVTWYTELTASDTTSQ
jgi:competence protein ComEC